MCRYLFYVWIRGYYRTSVQFSCSVVSDSLRPMNRSTPGLPVHHQLPESTQPMSIVSVMHPTNSSSVIPFSSCLQSFTASGSFPISWLFTSGGQTIRASASVLPMNILGWFPLGFTGLISLQSRGLWRVFSSTEFKGIDSSALNLFIIHLSHQYMTSGKNITLTIWTSVSKVMSLIFNTLSRLS